MSIPRIYRGIGEPQIASYNYNDIASGTGIVTFYGGEVSSGAYILSTNQFYSKKTYDSSSTLTDFSAPCVSCSFAILFSLPRIVGGDAVISIPLGMKQKSGQPGDNRIFPLVTINKLSGTQETNLVRTSGAIYLEAMASAETWNAVDIIKTTIPKTKFKTGDKMIVSVDVYNKTTGQAYTYLGHDPKNRASGAFDVVVGESVFSFTIDTNLIADIPFVIDL